MAHSTLIERRRASFFKRVHYFLNIRVMILFNKIKSFCQSLPIYYQHPRLFLADSLLFLCYLGFSPYRIHKKYMETINDPNPDAYGDTPLTTLIEIARVANIQSKNKCLDLGCGTGKIGFAWHLLFGCTYTGIDINPIFTKRGNFLSRLLHLNTYFNCKDMRAVDARGYDLVYLYGSLYSDTFISQVYTKLLELEKGAKVITVSYSLQNWDQNKHFEIIDMFTTPFPWGTAQVFIQKKVTAPEV